MPITPERLEKFRTLVSSLNPTCSIIFTQFDPDAAAAAMALSHLLTQLKSTNGGLKVKIFFGGSVGHPQNQAIANRFDLLRKMKPMKQFGAEDNRNVILVDSSSTNDNRLQTVHRIDPVMVIDHHRGGDVKEQEKTFVWVEDVGAVSTMIVELMDGLRIGFTDDQSMIPLLLAIGIHTDTGSLTDCTPRDRIAFTRATETVSNQDLIQLFRHPLPPSYFQILQHALEHQEVKDGKLVTHVGIIEAKEGDYLSIIADQLIRRSDVTLVVVWGIFRKEQVVRLSARSSDISNPLDMFLRDRFPPGTCGAKLSPDGHGIGGGMVNLDLNFWMVPETENEVVALASALVKAKIFGK